MAIALLIALIISLARRGNLPQKKETYL